MKKMLITALTLALWGTGHWAVADERGETQLQTILEALKDAETDALRNVLTVEFRVDLTDEAMRHLRRTLQDRLETGYTLEYLGKLLQEDFTVQFWKIAFGEGQEDVLVRMVLFDGEVAGFLITRPFV